VESGLGEGSIFRVFLPVPAEAVIRLSKKMATAPDVEGGGTVLLVEDEEPVRKMAVTMLTRLGFSVLQARDGLDAVEVFRHHGDEIRLVLCDLTMPRMSGWETLTALRTLSPDLPVILASGHDEGRVIADNHPQRPNAFLHKPFSRKELSDAIRKAGRLDFDRHAR
jgi:two-component system, cell cycle sensor histidine kinase and response regulator CckA